MEYNTFIFCIVRYIPASCSVYHRLSVLHYLLIGEGMLFPYSHLHCFAFTSVVFCGAIYQIHIPNIQNPYPCPRFRFGFCICRLPRGGRRGLLDGGSSSSSLVTAGRLSLGYHQPDSDHLNLHQTFIATLHFVKLCCFNCKMLW